MSCYSCFIAPLTCSVDIGEATPRTVCSGLVEHIPIEKMEVGAGLILTTPLWEVN